MEQHAEENPNPVILAYHSAKREVLWWYENEYVFNGWEPDREEGTRAHNLYAHLQNFILHGNTFIILEYHPNGFDPDKLSERASWWDDQLREQGYDVWGEGEETSRFDAAIGSPTS